MLFLTSRYFTPFQPGLPPGFEPGSFTVTVKMLPVTLWKLLFGIGQYTIVIENIFILFKREEVLYLT